MSKVPVTGEMSKRDASIKAIMFSLLFIPEGGEEGFQIGELFEVSEQFDEEEADRVIGKASNRGVGGSTKGSDEGEIDQGSNEAGETTGNLT
jgi:hypothetical protein